jgi:hypothetical protein
VKNFLMTIDKLLIGLISLPPLWHGVAYWLA